MKHVIFVIFLIILALIALRVFFWAATKVVALAIVVAAIYLVVRFFAGQKKR